MSTQIDRRAEGGLRTTLVHATVTAITEDGLGAVTLRGVARRSGVSHAAPAHHFGDKAGLFTAVATEGFELLTASLRASAAASRGRPAVERMCALGLAYVEFAVHHRAHFEVMFRPELLHPTDPAYSEAGREAFGELMTAVADAQREGWAKGWASDDVATMAWALVHGVATLGTQQALERGGTTAVRARAERITRIFVDALA